MTQSKTALSAVDELRDVSPQKDTYYLEEYKALRQDVLLQKAHQFAIQKWVIVSLGIVYGLTFGITNKDISGYIPEINKQLLLYSGVGISIFGAILSSITDYMLRNFSGYIFELEKRFTKGGGPEGWEHFMARHHHRPPGWGVIRNPFWWIVLFVSVFLVINATYKWVPSLVP